MTDQQKAAIINALRSMSAITSLQKDILDTWDALNNIQVDEKTARNQAFSNNLRHPDVFAAIKAMPGVVYKTAETFTRDDVIFTLSRQLDGLIAKELEVQVKDNTNKANLGNNR